MKARARNITRMTAGRLLRGGSAAAAFAVVTACHSATPLSHAHNAPNPASAPATIASIALLTAQANQPPLTPAQRDEIQFLSSILNDAAVNPSTRTGAAVRLLNMQLEQATAVLVDAMASGDHATMLAVIEAMQSARESTNGLLDAAINALPNAPASLLDPLALALARYNDRALPRVAALAKDQAAASEERSGPIHALGVFRSKAAAVELMALLDPSRDEPEAITVAACNALQRATGLPYGTDAQAWRQWWAQAKDQPREDWMSQIIQRLSEQLAAAQQHIEHERETARHTERRLAEAYRDLFARLSFEEQLNTLPNLLEDPLASIRSLALDRVARLLRDSVRISEELQHTIARRVDDESPAIRLQTARLLDQLNYEQTSRRVADRLQLETVPDVVSAMLELLARRPSPQGAAAALRWLGDATQGQRAAKVIWETMNLNSAANSDALAEVLSPAREATRTVIATEPTPAHVRLLAYIGDEDDVANLKVLLDGDNEVLRRRVAEGFVRRGVHQPLLERADDPVLFPFAVQAILAAPADLATVRTFLGWQVPEQHRQIWTDGIKQIAGSLAHDVVLPADDILAANTQINRQLRIDVLRQAINRTNGALTAELRDAIAVRLARLLMDTQQFVEAHELLNTINGASASPALLLLRFEAAVMTNHYDIAADIAQGPGMWMELLHRIEAASPDAALSIHNEIVRRFDGQLSAEMLAELDAMQQRLAPTDSAGDPDVGPDVESSTE
jgi:hypothetical protein